MDVEENLVTGLLGVNVICGQVKVVECDSTLCTVVHNFERRNIDLCVYILIVLIQ